MSNLLSKIIRKKQRPSENSNLKIISSKYRPSKYLSKSSKYWDHLRSKIIDLLQSTTIKVERNKADLYEFRCVYYSDYNLSVAKVIQDGVIARIEGLIKIPLPGNIVNDGVVEDSEDMTKIILDMSLALGIRQAPIILILPSSLFKLCTFNASELISNSTIDPSISAKSPYLPIDTVIQCDVLNTKYKELSRVMYVQKKLITSWLNTLIKLNSPIACLTTPVPHLLEALTKEDVETNRIVCDIELSNTTIFINRKEGDLISIKLPYGSDLYISNKVDNNADKFFIRLQQSIDTYASSDQSATTKNIYLFGNGLDPLIKPGTIIPKEFTKLTDTNIESFKYSASNEVKDIPNISSIMSSMAHLTSIAVKEK